MSDTDIDREQKQSALDRILGSSEFSGAERLKAFLKYIVAREIAGQKDMIIGKTILEDVYNKRSQESGDSAMVVRVDANRLRQRLEVYYSGEGKEDPVRMRIDKGGYVPSFFHGAPTTAEPEPPTHRTGSRKSFRSGAIAAALAAVIGIGVIGGLRIFSTDSSDQSVSTETPEARKALFENAPVKLLARNTAEEARELLFPATQLIRVSAALSMFEEAMTLDPNYYGGFAGASQASSILAALSPDPSLRKEHFQNAMGYADAALALDATKAWSHSAGAFAHFIARDFDAANKFSLTALELEPGNTHALEIDAVIALFSGFFERAIESADPSIHSDRPGQGLPWRNALGNAYFHVGNHAQSITHLTDAIKVGEPVSEINTAHLIAAYQASGDHQKAAELVEAFSMSWPESGVSSLLPQIFKNAEDAERVLREMRNAGWADPSIVQNDG